MIETGRPGMRKNGFLRSGRWAWAWLLACLCSWAAAAPPRPFAVGSLADDPRYDPRQLEKRYPGHPEGRPLEGAKVAAAESRFALDAIGVTLVLEPIEVRAAADIAATVSDLLRQNVQYFVLDLPAPAVVQATRAAAAAPAPPPNPPPHHHTLPPPPAPPGRGGGAGPAAHRLCRRRQCARPRLRAPSAAHPAQSAHAQRRAAAIPGRAQMAQGPAVAWPAAGGPVAAGRIPAIGQTLRRGLVRAAPVQTVQRPARARPVQPESVDHRGRLRRHRGRRQRRRICPLAALCQHIAAPGGRRQRPDRASLALGLGAQRRAATEPALWQISRPADAQLRLGRLGRRESSGGSGDGLAPSGLCPAARGADLRRSGARRLQRAAPELSPLGRAIAPAAVSGPPRWRDRHGAAGGLPASEKRPRRARCGCPGNSVPQSPLKQAMAHPVTHRMRALRAVAGREIGKFFQQPGRMLSSLVRPLLGFLVFAAGFQNIFGVAIIAPYPTYIEYKVYRAPGLLAMIALFNGMQSSLAMVYDREMGVMLLLLLTAPLPRGWLLACKLPAPLFPSF